ncbi:MAG TPA: hypothetical protein VHO69_03475 [Phototrophicaceae bacterium]|nr:hypothetical protein [Phototrophicaceae bacterium]
MSKTPLKDQRAASKQRIIDFVIQYRQENDISPTMREITQAIGFQERSSGTTSTYINELIEEGWLKRAVSDPKASRAILPTNKALTERYFVGGEEHTENS